MHCPRCQDTPLRELDRDGVTIDRCERCRGIWLDRGELEKLLAHARGADDDGDRSEDRRRDDGDRRRDDGDRRRHDDHDDDDRRYAGRKRSWWDIFD